MSILENMSKELKLNAINNDVFGRMNTSPYFPAIPPAPVQSPIYYGPENIFQNAAFCNSHIRPVVYKCANLKFIGTNEEKYSVVWEKPHMGRAISSPVAQYFLEATTKHPAGVFDIPYRDDFYKLIIRIGHLVKKESESKERYALDIRFNQVSVESLLGGKHPIKDVIRVTNLIKEKVGSISYSKQSESEIVIGKDMATGEEICNPVQAKGSVYIGFMDAFDVFTEASMYGVESVDIKKINN